MKYASAVFAALTAAGLIAGPGCRKSNILSRGEEIRIGSEGSKHVEKKWPLSRNPADISLVERIGQKLVAANNLTQWPFTFKVLEAREVNAVSLPGGPVYVFRGLLDMTEGDRDELAAVIGHEIAHIQKRHLAKMYTQGVFTDLILTLGTRGTARTAGQIAQIFMEAGFSREDEYDSDRLAIRYGYQAGYDPNGLVRFFEKLKRLEKQGKGDLISNNLRSHPLTTARIDRARKEIRNTVR